MTYHLPDNPLKSRDDMARALRDLVAPLLARFSPGRAGLDLGATGARHDLASAGLEAFARPLWGLVPLAAGGFDFEHWELWRAGLANGCDPDHPEFWGWPAPVDQRLVEMAAVGFGLALVPEVLFEPLEARARAHVIAYLRAAYEAEFADCNWKFFRLLIGAGLARVGVETDRELAETYLDEIDAFHLGDGWYNDGKPHQVDHYIPFAFQFYGLVLAALGAQPERAAAFRARAAAFAPEIRHWYGPDGAALPFGRSLGYRFAHAGFWGALAFAGVEALPWGQIKGYALRNLRYWARQPIRDGGGLLTIGYAYPNLLMSEGYNAPGSPYWALKAFLPLALPADHPFWTAEEAAPDPAPDPVPLPRAGMVMQALPGHQVALASGQELGNMRHGAEKYAKFAYSTRYAFSVEVDERQFTEAASDNMLTLSDDGVHMRFREANAEALIAGDTLYARWHPWADVTVETWLVPAGAWHLRLHEITTPRALDSIEGGFAIARPDRDSDGWQVRTGTGLARLETGADVSVIFGQDHREGRGHVALPNSNLVAPRSLVPQLIGRIEPGRTRLASAVLALPSGIAEPPRPDFPDIEALRARLAAEGRPVLSADS